MSAGSRRYLAVGVFATLVLLPSVGRGQVSITFIWNQPFMETFFVADFIDMAQETGDTSSHPDLFTAVLTNSNPFVTQQVVVKITFSIYNLNAAGLSENMEGLAWLQTKLISLDDPDNPLSPSPRIFTNRDLAQQGSDIEIDQSDYDSGATDELQDLILQTGLLPSGHYVFIVELLDASLQPIQTPIQIDRWVRNPTRVDLIGPGDEFGQTLPVVATGTPQFFWSTDASWTTNPSATGLTRFQIRVVKVEDATSAEEAMSAFAVWEEVILDQTTAIYPSSVAAIQLEAGASYAWQVLRSVETSSGSVDIESPIYWFKMEDPAAGVVGATVDEEVNQMIDQIQEMQGVGDQLEGYRPTGQVLVDGQPMNLNALRNLLEQVLNGQLQIITIIIR